MLRELSIQDFAIIEETRIEFSPGLNILTGETGAGKSLLVGALELVLGERARAEWIRSGAEEARVEAVFDLDTTEEISPILQEAGYADEEILVIKRTVNRSGKNRIYVNDQAATRILLERLGQQLVDIHGQHEHQSLLHIKRQRELLDLFGNLVPLQSRVASLYRSLYEHRQKRSRLQEEHERMVSDRDLAIHQCEEISQARLRVGEEEELELERQRLLHVERLREICGESEQVLYSDQKSMVDTLGTLQKRLQDAVEIDPTLTDPLEQLETACHYLEEAARQLQRYEANIEGDPARLEQIEERLAFFSRLKRKYHRNVEELLSLEKELSERIRRLDHMDEEREAISAEISRMEAELLQAAQKLSQGRRQTAKKLETEVEKELRALGMKKTGFHAEIKPFSSEPSAKETDEVRLEGGRIGSSGMDRIEFLIRPNPGQDFRPLRRIASGGELSRVMLAMRNVLRGSDKLPTLVFDEVDAGVGGAEAEAVGSRLEALSRDFQVLCITHLPQIAVFGDGHLKVTKQLQRNRTRFQIQRLDTTAREKEIARMLGGARITDKTLAHAREMLQQGARKEQK